MQSLSRGSHPSNQDSLHLHLHRHQLSASTLRRHLPPSFSFSFLPLLTLALSLAACSQLSLAAHLCQALGQDETIQAKLTTRRRRRSTTAPPTCPDTSVAKPPDAVTHRAPPRSPVPPSLLTPHPASQPDGEVPSLSIPHPTRDRPATTTPQRPAPIAPSTARRSARTGIRSGTCNIAHCDPRVLVLVLVPSTRLDRPVCAARRL